MSSLFHDAPLIVQLRKLGRLALLVAVWAVLSALVAHQTPVVPATPWQAGEIAPRSVYAPFSIQTEELDVKLGELVVQRGQRITPEHARVLQEFQRLEGSRTHPMARAGGGGLSVALIVLAALVFLRLSEPRLYRHTAHLMLIALVSFLTLGLAKLIAPNPWLSAAIPIAMASLLLGVIFHARVALFLTVMLGLLFGLMTGDRLGAMLTLTVGGLAGIVAVQRIRRRGQLLRAGLIVGATQLLCLWAAHILLDQTMLLPRWDAAVTFASGLVASLLVMALLPFIEHLFQITTDIRLLELSDLNHPLLKEMILKAPGTYYHSLIVGNLAEAACEAIGANGLLARVGAYFHDIGKIEQADYFIENQGGQPKVHDHLSPTISSLVITNHVKRGIELGRRHKLPEAIIDFIPQHHGTGLVFYFYHRALERLKAEHLREEDFRYRGPKPQSRETAVMLLADSVEASSRALEDPTPARIRHLVRKVINNKFIDGQLDECDLTLRNLHVIAETFTRVLLGVHHVRIQYPETDVEPSHANETAAAGSARGAGHPSHA